MIHSAMLFLWILISTFESLHCLTITAYHQCLDVGSLNPSDFTTLNTIGVQQCMRRCLEDRNCLSLNYWRNELRCTLHKVNAGGTYSLVPDSDGIYIERQDSSMILAPLCTASHCQGVCKPLTYGGLFCETNGTTAFLKEISSNVTTPLPTTTTTASQPTTTNTTPQPTITTTAPQTTTNTVQTQTTTTTVQTQTTTTSAPQTTTSATTLTTTAAMTVTTTTTPAPTCPLDFKWDANIPFCHKITTDPKETWPDARAACQTVGAELAIIDVSAKFSKILSDPDRPSNSFNHWMGGVFNTTTNSYQWVDGRDVGATFSTTYGLSGAVDSCLYWYDLSPQAREKKCLVGKYSYVCEYRNGLY